MFAVSPPTSSVYGHVSESVGQNSKPLAELLDGYPKNPIRGIDTSKYGVPPLEEGASIDELVEAERRGRVGEGHMALRWVTSIQLAGSCSLNKS